MAGTPHEPAQGAAARERLPAELPRRSCRTDRESNPEQLTHTRQHPAIQITSRLHRSTASPRCASPAAPTETHCCRLQASAPPPCQVCTYPTHPEYAPYRVCPHPPRRVCRSLREVAPEAARRKRESSARLTVAYPAASPSSPH